MKRDWLTIGLLAMLAMAPGLCYGAELLVDRATGLVTIAGINGGKWGADEGCAECPTAVVSVSDVALEAELAVRMQDKVVAGQTIPGEANPKKIRPYYKNIEIERVPCGENQHRVCVTLERREMKRWDFATASLKPVNLLVRKWVAEEPKP